MDNDALNKIASGLGGETQFSDHNAFINVKPENAPEACRMVAALPGMYHLSTVSGMDNGEEIEILYHFWKDREIVSVRTAVSKESPALPTATKAVPSAVMYEAEIHDMLGVEFTGNELMAHRLLLPDDYPKEAPPPLRKEANPEEIRRMMGLE